MNNFHLHPLIKVLDHIGQHLDEGLTLKSIASIGNYSAYHFHRLFRAYTDETLNGYITRKRLEKIAALLIRSRGLRVTELAYAYGFSGNAALTKTFKKYYGISPSAFKKLSTSQYDKIIKSKNGQYFQGFEQYICRMDNLKNWIEMKAQVAVGECSPLKMVYLNHIGVQGLEDSFKRIIDWTITKGLVEQRALEIVRVYYDSFKITDADKVRMGVGVVVKEPVKTELDIHYREFQPGQCIIGSFEIGVDEFEQSWSSLFVWMNENGYRPSDELPFEIIKNNYHEHSEKKCIVDLCIPI